MEEIVLPRLTYDSRERGDLPIELWPEWQAVFDCPASMMLAMGGEGSGKSFHGGLYATCRMFYDLQFNG